MPETSLSLFGYILSELERHDLKDIFGVMGREASEMSFNSTSLRYRLMRHEFSAAMAAAAMGYFRQKPGICLSTVGPGATNFATALASAFMSRWPMLALSVQAEEFDQIYGETHQCIDQLNILRPVSRYAAELRSSDAVDETLQQALSSACGNPGGPAFLSIPIDLLNKQVSGLRPCVIPEQMTAEHSPLAEDIDKAVSLLSAAERPIVIAGAEAVQPGVHSTVIEFCEQFQIPVVTAYNAKGILPSSHPLHRGPITPYMDALSGKPALESIFSNCDLILQLGLIYAEDIRNSMFTYGKRKSLVRLCRHSWPRIPLLKADVEINGDLNRSLVALAEKIKPKRVVSPEPHEALAILDSMLKVSDDEPLGILGTIKTLNRFADEQILVVDTGMFRHYSVAFYRPNAPKHFLTDAGLSTFAFGLPAGIGVQLANPHKRVVVLAGDGGFHASSQELESLARFNLPLIVIVINNSQNGLIRFYQMKGNQAPDRNIVGFGSVDFVKLAEANGVEGRLVDSARELTKILSAPRTTPLLIEVRTDYAYEKMTTFSGLSVG